MSSTYHDGSRRLQDRFDTRRLADRLDERFVQHPSIGPEDRAFIERLDMFFLATADAEGRPQCSYKGGEPGFVRVLDERTVAFPNYDGNGMYLSMGNLSVNPHVGMLFIDFVSARPSRLRLNGIASIDEHDELMGSYPEAQFVVRVRATEVFPNCPRYIHRMALVERSRFVPSAERETPVPAWKRTDWACDVLPADDPRATELARQAQVLAALSKFKVRRAIICAVERLNGRVRTANDARDRQDTHPTTAVEDYAKAIYSLSHDGRDPVTTNALAERLSVTPASASAMVKRLDELGLARHAPYHGVELTKRGSKLALEIIRHHRLLELYLAESLGVPGTASTTRPRSWSTCSPRSSRS